MAAVLPWQMAPSAQQIARAMAVSDIDVRVDRLLAIALVIAERDRLCQALERAVAAIEGATFRPAGVAALLPALRAALAATSRER